MKGVAGQVLVTGYVSDELLVQLYQSTELVLFPSFYEGFGLPVLEARRCGARVICSGASSLPEVLGDERALFNPWAIDEIAERLESALIDPEFAAELDRVPDSGFTWSRAAERLTAVYRSLARPQRPVVDRSRNRRLGVVTLMPPTPSGIADHSERIVRAIHDDIEGVDVSVFVERTATWSALDVPYPIHDLSSLPARWVAGEFDAVLYCLGNNHFHSSFRSMMRVVPGHALLHDVRLRGAFDPLRINQFAQRYYDDQVDDGTLFAAPVARSAISVLVQSAHAADLVFADSGVTAVDVGPHHCPTVDPAGPVDDASRPWVVSAGIADVAKQSDVFVAAMDELGRRRDVRAALVGLGGERFVTEGDGIVATGAVDDAAFCAWLQRAAVMVQLRRTSNGESSGVVAHALARGIPLIVSDVGAMAELPDEVAVKIPVDVTPKELADAVDQLLGDAGRRAAMRAAALDLAGRETPLAQARRIVEAIFE